MAEKLVRSLALGVGMLFVGVIVGQAEPPLQPGPELVVRKVRYPQDQLGPTLKVVGGTHGKRHWEITHGEGVGLWGLDRDHADGFLSLVVNSIPFYEEFSARSCPVDVRVERHLGHMDLDSAKSASDLMSSSGSVSLRMVCEDGNVMLELYFSDLNDGGGKAYVKPSDFKAALFSVVSLLEAPLNELAGVELRK